MSWCTVVLRLFVGKPAEAPSWESIPDKHSPVNYNFNSFRCHFRSGGEEREKNWVSAYNDKHRTINVRQRPRASQRTDWRRPNRSGRKAFLSGNMGGSVKCNANIQNTFALIKRPKLHHCIIRLWYVSCISNPVTLEEAYFHARRVRWAPNSMQMLQNLKRCPLKVPQSHLSLFKLPIALLHHVHLNVIPKALYCLCIPGKNKHSALLAPISPPQKCAKVTFRWYFGCLFSQMTFLLLSLSSAFWQHLFQALRASMHMWHHIGMLQFIWHDVHR